MTIVHTSKHEAGQIYIPEVNKAADGRLPAARRSCSRTSTTLGAAYGIAVTGTMAITSLLFARRRARRAGTGRSWHVVAAHAAFLRRSTSRFLAANVIKIEHGGWVPLVDRDRRLHADEHVEDAAACMLDHAHPGRRAAARPLPRRRRRDASRTRVPGTAVFMTSSNDGVPVVLLHHLKHNKVLHEQVMLHVGRRRAEVPESQGGRARHGREARARLLPRHGALRLHGDAERAGDPAAARAKRASTPSRTTRRSISAASASSSPTASSKPGTRRAPTTRYCRAWRAGARSSSSSCRATRARRRSSSAFRRTASSSWARRSSSDGMRVRMRATGTARSLRCASHSPCSAFALARDAAARYQIDRLPDAIAPCRTHVADSIARDIVAIRGRRCIASTSGIMKLSPPMIVIERPWRGRSLTRADFTFTFLILAVVVDAEVDVVARLELARSRARDGSRSSCGRCSRRHRRRGGRGRRRR